MHGLFLILPNIRSAHNVGAMFRTADAFAVEKIYLCGYTAQPPKPQIDKVSLGAETWVPWEQVSDCTSLIQKLREEGVRILGLEHTSDSNDIGSITLDSSCAVIVGNEDLLSLCDDIVHIPMLGRKESLNVSVAAGIALYHLRNS